MLALFSNKYRLELDLLNNAIEMIGYIFNYIFRYYWIICYNHFYCCVLELCVISNNLRDLSFSFFFLKYTFFINLSYRFKYIFSFI